MNTVHTLRNLRNKCQEIDDRIVQRHRKLDTLTCLHTILETASDKHASYSVALQNAAYYRAKELNRGPSEDCVSPAAFDRFRNKISTQDMMDLYNTVVDGIINKASKRPRTVFIDGSKFRTKTENLRFKVHTNAHYATGYLSVMVDHETGIALSLVASPNGNERESMIQNIEDYNLPPESTLSADRGYASAKTFDYLYEKKIHFVLRLCSTNDKQLAPAIASKKKVEIVNYTTTSMGTRKLKIIKYTVAKQPYFIITDLLNVPHVNLKNIYRQRWEVEEYYKLFKQEEGATLTHAIKDEFMYQELYGRAMIVALCRLMELESVEYANYDFETQRKSNERNYLLADKNPDSDYCFRKINTQCTLAALSRSLPVFLYAEREKKQLKEMAEIVQMLLKRTTAIRIKDLRHATRKTFTPAAEFSLKRKAQTEKDEVFQKAKREIVDMAKKALAKAKKDLKNALSMNVNIRSSGDSSSQEEEDCSPILDLFQDDELFTRILEKMQQKKRNKRPSRTSRFKRHDSDSESDSDSE